MKKIILINLVFAMVIMMSITAFAGTWKQDVSGWWWDNGDGTYPKNCWQWCDDNGDGIAECFYFDGNGYCLSNTTTPDGCTVNNDGKWIINGVIQSQVITPGALASGDAETMKVTVNTLNSSVDPSKCKSSNVGNTIYYDSYDYGDESLRPVLRASYIEIEKQFANGNKDFADSLTGIFGYRILYNVRSYFNNALLYSVTY